MAIVLTIITVIMWFGILLALSVKADMVAAILVSIAAMVGLLSLIVYTAMAWRAGL